MTRSARADLARRARGRRALAAGILSALGGCSAKTDPAGHHTGSCVVHTRPVGAASDAPVAGESCGDSFEVWREGDGYKLELGDCTVHLSPPARPGDTEWKIAGVAPCRTKAGPSRMVEGKLYRIAGTYNFTFDGATDDKKTAVSWAFAGDAKGD
jgi:hypothetical protein